jgi:two-component system OmpR family response regulator
MARQTMSRLAGKSEDEMKLLLVEDDKDTADYVSRGLREQGHVIDHAANGRDGLFLAGDGAYDVLIVDRMLPGIDGLGVVRMLRDTGVRTPVLVLTALGGVGDRVKGLDAGADDYLAKPFAFAELLARLNALARRPPLVDVQTVLRVGDLEMNLLKRTVTRGGKEIDLQPREFQLLEYLMRNAERVVTRTMLLEAVWDFHFDPRTNIVETHVSRLRAKLAQTGAPELIHTVRGAGYVLRSPGPIANA